MNRRQQNIPGTQRETNDEVEKAANAYRETRDERMELTKRETQKKLALIAAMQAAKITKYKFDDADGEELLVALDEKVNVKVRKTGEAADEVGEAVDDPDDGVPKDSVLAEAAKAQDAADPFASARSELEKPKRARKGKSK